MDKLGIDLGNGLWRTLQMLARSKDRSLTTSARRSSARGPIPGPIRVDDVAAPWGSATFRDPGTNPRGGRPSVAAFEPTAALKIRAAMMRRGAKFKREIFQTANLSTRPCPGATLSDSWRPLRSKVAIAHEQADSVP